LPTAEPFKATTRIKHSEKRKVKLKLPEIWKRGVFASRN